MSGHTKYVSTMDLFERKLNPGCGFGSFPHGTSHIHEITKEPLKQLLREELSELTYRYINCAVFSTGSLNIPRCCTKHK